MSIKARLWGVGVGALFAFLAFAAFFSVENMIVVLNGMFFGTMCAIVVAYWRLLTSSLFGGRPYDRVSHAAFGFFLLWVAYVPVVVVSVYLRSAGFDVNASYLTAFSRVVAIAAAIFQVTAPDFGYGVFYGRDRRLLWLGLAVGLVIASFTIYAQRDQVLAIVRASPKLSPGALSSPQSSHENQRSSPRRLMLIRASSLRP